MDKIDKTDKMEKYFESYNEFVKYDLKSLENRINLIAQEVSKYQGILFSLKKKYNDYDIKLKEVWRERFLYYKLDFNITLKDSDIKQFIERDAEYLEVLKKLNNTIIYIEKIEAALKNLDSMRWDIKSLIEWKKYEAGMLSGI